MIRLHDKVIAEFLDQSKSSNRRQESCWFEDRTLWSYRTAIARLNGNTLTMDTTKYSVTTATKQHALKLAAQERGLKIIETEIGIKP